jgi:hypothetical protein
MDASILQGRRAEPRGGLLERLPAHDLDGEAASLS